MPAVIKLQSDQLADGSVVEAIVADDALSAAKLKSGSVTEPKLAAAGVPQRDAQLVLDETAAGGGFVVGSGAEGAVTQLASPGMAVRVQTGGTAWDYAGLRKAIPTSASLAITAADVTNPRIDTVVLNAAGALAVRAGTPGATPAPPTLTSGDVPLANVAVAANASTVVTANITDIRNRQPINGAKIRNGSIPRAAFLVQPRTALFAGNSSDTKFSLTGPVVSPLLNGYFGVFVYRNGARIANVTASAPSGLDEYRVIEESNVTKVELGGALPTGQSLIVDWES